MTPYRNCPYPYDAYFAEGTLFISPALEARFPAVYEMLAPCIGGSKADSLDEPLRQALASAHILTADGKAFQKSVHGDVLKGVLPMGGGDVYQ